MGSLEEMTEQQVKTYIKSILTSNPVISTIQSVARDYRDMIGTPVPYQKLRFNSLEHFLKSIPDTCVVRGTGPLAHVALVPSVKSAHINEMVVQQKVNKKGPRKFLTPRRRSGPAYPPAVRRNPLSWRPAANYSFSPNSSCSSTSSFGYSSTEVPKTTIINNNVAPHGNVGSKNVTQQGIQSTNTEIKGFNFYPFANKNAEVHSMSTGITNINIQGPTTGDANKSGQNARGLSDIKVSGLIGENTPERRSFVEEQNKVESRNVKQQLDKLVQKQSQLEKDVPSTSTPIKESIRSAHDRVAAWNNQCPSNDNQREGYFEDISCKGDDEYFNRSKEKLNNLLHNFRSYEEEKEDTSNVPKRVQLNLITVISQFMDGIWCGDLPDHYKRLFKKDLTYMEYGYTSLIEMCIALDHIFHYVRPGKDDFKLYDRSKPLPDSVVKTYTMASYSVGEKVSMTEALPNLSWDDFKFHIPDDILKLGEDIPREFLPVGTKVDTIFDVVVTEIYDPSKFWFYLGTSERTTDLDKLMDQLQTFYGKPENAKEYAIPSGAIKEGLYCVQVIYAEYHRARIMRVLGDDPEHVRVMYIDYGTACKVPIKGMCFLHKDFAALKAQGIRCRLANIAPDTAGHPWPRSASDRLRTLINRRDTKIKVSYIDWDQEYVCVFLADVTDKDNIVYLNEVLVKENHALWEGQRQKERFVLSNFTCIVQNIHLFPTFVELEYGWAATASEMYALANMLVPLHFALPNYFELKPEIPEINYDEIIEETENCFTETVKNHRKFTYMDQVEFNPDIMNPQPIDFDVFADLKDEMMEFCRSENLEGAGGGGVQPRHTSPEEDREEESFCDVVEEVAAMEIDRALKACEPLQLVRKNEELTDSVIHKLERYSLMGSEHSSDTESVAGTSRSIAGSIRTECSEPQEELSERDGADQLSTILEQSEIETESLGARESHRTAFSGLVGLNKRQSRPEFNIFDDPEEFEGDVDSDDSDVSGIERLSAESFLQIVEKRIKEDSREEIEHGEQTICATENTPDSGNPFRFNIGPELNDRELREEFITFLKTRKANSCNVSVGGSSFVRRASGACRCGKRGCPGHGDAASEIDVTFESNLQDTRLSFVSTLSLNNPFRTSCEGGESTDLSAASTEYTHLDDYFTKNLRETDRRRKDADIERRLISSDSEGSDYKVFVPRGSHRDQAVGSEQRAQNFPSKFPRAETPPRMKNKHRADGMANQENARSSVRASMEGRCVNAPRVDTPPRLTNQDGGDGAPNREWQRSWSQSSMGGRGVINPPRLDTPPRLFTPPSLHPIQWSHGPGFPVPHYTQWSNGGHQPMPGTNCPPPMPGANYPPMHGPNYPPMPGPNYPPIPGANYPPMPGANYPPMAGANYPPMAGANYPPVAGANYPSMPGAIIIRPRDSLRPPPGITHQGVPPNYNPYFTPRMVSTGPGYEQVGPIYYPPPNQMLVPPLATIENDFYDRYNKSILQRSNEPS